MTESDTNTQGREVHSRSLLATVISGDKAMLRRMQWAEQAFEEDRRQYESWARFGFTAVPGTTIRDAR